MEIKEYDWLGQSTKQLVIYGTTVGGKIILQCLKKIGIKPVFFCDRSKKYSEFCNLPVKLPSELDNNEDKYMVLIAVTRSFDSVCQYMKEIGYQTIYSCNNLIKNIKISNSIFIDNEKELVEDFYEKYPVYVKNDMEDIILPSLEIFITERCTLRCRDCSHLIPRYMRPKDYSIEEIIEDINNVLKIVKKISDLIILGGEPILHKELYKLLDWAYEQEKIGVVTIISNGSIGLEQTLLDTMKRTNTRIRLSDYGKYSRKLNEIVSECKKKEITCYVNNELWTDMGPIYNHNYSMDELEKVYVDCPFAYDFLLLNGKIFRCAHVAHLNNLNVIDSSEHDCVNIKNLMDWNINDKKEELKKYMQIKFLYGCNYCNGIKNSIQGIEPAIQGKR